MAGIAATLDGVTAYILFLGTFLYKIEFVAGSPLSKSIDSGAGGPLSVSIAIDAALLGLFAIQHSVQSKVLQAACSTAC